ncbi:Slp family lipoprotein [Thalassotalea ganghwensis]
MIKKISICSALFMLTSACTSIPEPLKMSKSTPLTTYENVRQAPEQVNGQAARWGGVIANVSNQAKSTILEVVHFPLTRSAKPKQQDQTLGRFKVYYQGLLDPMIYQKGRSITAVGTLSPLEMGKIGEHEYQYPVLKADYVHLWKDVKQVDVNIWHSGFWHPNRYWDPYRPYYHRPVIIHKKAKPRGASSSGQKVNNSKSKAVR